MHHRDHAQIVKKKVIGQKIVLNLEDQCSVSIVTKRDILLSDVVNLEDRLSAEIAMDKVTEYMTVQNHSISMIFQ